MENKVYSEEEKLDLIQELMAGAPKLEFVRIKISPRRWQLGKVTCHIEQMHQEDAYAVYTVNPITISLNYEQMNSLWVYLTVHRGLLEGHLAWITDEDIKRKYSKESENV